MTKNKNDSKRTPLNDSGIKAAKPNTKNSYYIWDYTGQRGGGALGCKVYPSAKKNFYFRYVKDKKRVFVFLGTYPNLTLNDARARKLELSSLLDSGVDPKDFVENKKQNSLLELSFINEDGIEKQQGMFSDMVDVYVDELKRTRSGEKLTRCIDRFEKNYQYYISDFPEMPVNQITKRDVMIFLSPIAKRAPVQADKIRSILHRMFELAIDYEDEARFVDSDICFNIDSNPVQRIKKQNNSKPRKRSLSLDELALLFSLESEQYFNPSIFRLLKLSVLMGGQRPIELILTSSDDFNQNSHELFIREDASKNLRGNLLPKLSAASDIIRQQLEIKSLSKNDNPYLFFAQNKYGYLDISYVAEQIRDFCIATGFERFQARDLRRSVKNILLQLKVSRDHTNYLQNHSFGDVAESNYITYEFFEEKREALAKLEQALKEASERISSESR